MSYLYDEYLYDHISGVRKAFEWLCEHEIIPKDTYLPNLNEHDESKRGEKEYKAYDDYFYGTRSAKVVEAFNYAWLYHIHKNKHHWQYWVLQHDDEPCCGNSESENWRVDYEIHRSHLRRCKSHTHK